MATPEAEPQQNSSPAEQGASSQKEKIVGNDGASLPLSKAQQKQIIDQLQKEQAQSAPSTPETRESMFHQTADFFRGKIKTVLIGGAFIANPVVGTTLFLGDKVARKTVSKIPVVKHAYEIPRGIAVGTGNAINEGITRTVALPAFAADRVHDVYQGITGIETTEARSFVGKVAEQSAEFVGSVFKFAKETAVVTGKKGLELAEKSIEVALKTIAGIIKVPYQMVHGAVKNVAGGTKWAMAAGPTGIVTSALTTALIGWGVWSFGAGMPAAQYWPWLGDMIAKGFAAGRTALGI